MKLNFLLLTASLLLAACSKGGQTAATETAATAPATYRVAFDLSCGPVEIDVTRADSPLGADRFYNLVKAHYFDGARFFRVVPGFIVQFGLAADPAVTKAWDQPILDEPVKTSNVRGTLTFAKPSEPNHRTTQLFINLGNNPNLDRMGFSPFGKVVQGMDAIDKIYAGDGQRPNQGQITDEGNAYLQKAFPHLDYIKTARLLP